MSQILPSENQTSGQENSSQGMNLIEGDPSPFALIIPTKNYWVTPVLIFINVLVFILMIADGVHFMEPTTEDLLKWGANYRPQTFSGEWWRLLTCCFVHIGIIHLAMNVYAFVTVGYLLEPLLGKKNFLLGYLLTGIAASLTSLWWHDNTVSAGASGAIFGVYGIFAAMLTTNLIHKEERQAQLSSLVVFVGYNLVYGLRGGVDNSAHIGGLVSGFIFGYGFFYILKNPLNLKLKIGITSSMIVLVLLYGLVISKTVSNDMSIYYSKMDEFSALEDKGMEVYKLPDSTEKTVYLDKINTSISSFKKAEVLAGEIEKLDIPENVLDRNKILKSYCKTRVRLFELIYKSIKEDTNKYDEEIKECNEKIQARLNEIKKL